MKPQIHFCTTDDNVRIAYARSGSGPPLIRVANWLTHVDRDWQSPIWAHWFRELSRGNTLIRYDARGTGLSDRGVEDLSVEMWQRDLDAVVNDLGLERFALLGRFGRRYEVYREQVPMLIPRLSPLQTDVVTQQAEASPSQSTAG